VNYIFVESVADYGTKVTSLGGKVLVPKTAVPTMGYFVVFQDPQGNVLGMWESDKDAK
jgi:predicted enzyme related to lactoylglutathione lyase